jgi:hypothetical protein
MYAYSFRVGVDSRHKPPASRGTSVLRETARRTAGVTVAVTAVDSRQRSTGVGAGTSPTAAGQGSDDAQR